jgi:hypothetical protein
VEDQRVSIDVADSTVTRKLKLLFVNAYELKSQMCMEREI